jgi:hypothetical protein
MTERAAHLVDHVFPDVPVRQWVLSLPYRLRYLLAWDHDLCRAVAGVLSQAVFRLLRERARDAGVEGGRSGGVIVIQRFGGALNLNVHLHALVLDGVFAPDSAGGLRFHRTRRLTSVDVDEVLATVEPLVARRLRSRGFAEDDETDIADVWTEEAPVLAGLAAASVQGRLALAPRPGGRPGRLGEQRASSEARTPGRCHAQANGFRLRRPRCRAAPADRRSHERSE